VNCLEVIVEERKNALGPKSLRNQCVKELVLDRLDLLQIIDFIDPNKERCRLPLNTVLRVKAFFIEGVHASARQDCANVRAHPCLHCCGIAFNGSRSEDIDIVTLVDLASEASRAKRAFVPLRTGFTLVPTRACRSRRSRGACLASFAGVRGGSEASIDREL
jgi:hypothetical protein